MYIIILMKFKHVILETQNQFDKYNETLKSFEHTLKNYYPIDNDFFSIIHPDKYVTFFVNMGKVYYIVMYNDNNDIIGTCCVILRTINNKHCWYICDLKLLKEYRGHNTTFKLILFTMPKFILTTMRFYYVSMDNTILQKILKKLFILNYFIDTNVLCIYKIKYRDIKIHIHIFNEILGTISFVNINNTKRLILKSTNDELNIYHLQHGIFATHSNVTHLCEDADVMFCAMKYSMFYNFLVSHNYEIYANATIVSLGLNNDEISQILTSQI